jgi:ABC-2 type transport system permease protein
MNKTSLVISREYFTRVKKKSFLITTILVPLIIVGFYAAIIAIAVKGEGGKQAIAVIDEAGIFNETIESKNGAIDFDIIKGEKEKSYKSRYKEKGYEALLYIPPINLDSPRHIVLNSHSSLSLSTTSAVERAVNKAIEDKRLQAQGIDPEKYRAIAADVSIENTVDSGDGTKKSVAGVAYAVSFACGLLIYLMMIIYGTQVMRGVMEEKTNRIAEVVVSSVRPFQLMMGKIIGIGAVGLTQFAVWIVLIFGMQFFIPMLFPDFSQQLSNPEAQDGLINIAQGLSSLPLAKILLSFLFYFLGGYLTYASLFAAIGSVVSDDQQDAQQLVFPVLMPIILGFVIMSKAINDPHSSLAVFGSLFPLTSPIVMMGRITYDIPVWELMLSMALLVGCFLLFTWLTGKIYRTGILMYGKKPSWKEMMKWAFRKS